MTWAPTPRLYVSGYRFLRRRLECALLRRDIRTVNEPLHAQGFALLAGSMLAAAAVAGCAIFGTMRPQSTLGDAPIVLVGDSGALYVRVDDVWHPVPNLASARLVVGRDVSPHLVRESALAHAKRGPLLGIAGAPPDVGEPLTPAETGWAICDSRGSVGPTTTAIVGTAAVQLVHGLAAEQTVLATTAANAPVYLLYHGQRAVVDPTDPVVTRALRLEGRRPRRVSRTLLNAVPEAPPITAPRIVDGRRSGAVPGFPVPVATFPDRASAPLNDADATLCVSWAAGHTGADVSFWTGQGLPLPADAVPVGLAQADNDGPVLDAVYLPAGRSAYVRSAGLGGDKTRAGARYLVTAGGVRFGIHDDEAARALGLPVVAAVAPWPVLAALPQGPELSRQSASVPRDTVVAGSRADPGPP